MSASNEHSGVWLSEASAVIERIRDGQVQHISQLAEWCADVIADQRLVHVFGSGHSRIPVEEMFPRYGSYPGFHPMVELSMTFHTQVVGANGQRQAMFIERTEGLAEVILSNFSIGPGDVMIVFSVSGTSAVPIEMAMGARSRGARVAAVTSLDHTAASASLHSSGTRLADHADLVIDLCVPVGDAAVALEHVETPVGPTSTIAAVAVANELKVQTASLLANAGALPAVLTASAVVGAETSRSLFDDAYGDYARRVARLISDETGQ